MESKNLAVAVRFPAIAHQTGTQSDDRLVGLNDLKYSKNMGNGTH